MYSKDFVEKVRELYEKKKNYREVATALNMSHSSVIYMVKNKYERIKKQRGPKRLVNNREKTKIKKEVRRLKSENHRVTANKVKDNCGIDASIRTVQRELSRLGFGYKNIPKKLPLTKRHKDKRVELARKWISDNLIGKNIVFSDEKRFKCDGPDNWCSWYDPFDPPSRIKRQMGGGGIMVWGMTLPNGEIYVQKLDGKVDSANYISLLKYKVKPFLLTHYPENDFLFQQDNCKVHVSKKTTNYLKSAKINTFEWPSFSPDLNIQENVWKMISDIVFDQKQYENFENLWLAIKESVNKINSTKKETVKSIYDNFNKRLLAVMDNKGNEIPY